jgi:hypothetical protein
MPLLEANYYALWLGKQTAKGTANTAPSKRLIQVGGGLDSARDDGQENYSDLTKYGTSTDWVNSLLGSGEPIVEATPEEMAYLLWLFHGAETVTAVTGPPTASQHRFQPTTSLGFYFTVFTRVGSTNIIKRQSNDCIMSRIAFEASSANKAARLTARIVSLDPGAIYTTDPTQALPTDRPFLHTDLALNAGSTSDGSMVIDGVTFRGITQSSLVIDDAWEPVYGDDSRPYDWVQGNPSVTVGATLLLDSVGLGQWNRLIYGTTSPTVGTKPLRAIPALGSLVATMRQRDSAGTFNGRELIINVPGVKWTPPPAPAPAPDGGATEIALAGEMRTITSTPAYTIDVRAAATVVAFTT